MRKLFIVPTVRRAGMPVAAALALLTWLALPDASQAGQRGQSWVAGSMAGDAWRVEPEDLILVDSSDDFGAFTVNVQLAQVDDDTNDPLESLNRVIFDFNDVVYSYLLGPVADVYGLLPEHLRSMISNILTNLSAPVVFFNDILQGEPERAATTLARFVMNSTIGLGGMVDIAESAGFEEHDEDFGQTLAVWGVGEGFYLVLPLLGPSSPRDAIGQFLVDPFIDPFNIYLDNTGQEDWEYARIGATAVDEFAKVRDELENIKRTSVDYYAAVRSLYRQKRASEIGNGSDLDLPPIPDFDLGGDELFPDDTEPATVPEPDDDSQRLSALSISVGTSSSPLVAPAGDEALWRNPLGARFAPAEGGFGISDGAITCWRQESRHRPSMSFVPALSRLRWRPWA